MQLRSPRARTRLVDPGVPAPGSVALTYGDGLILDATPPPKLQVDFGTGHDQVARGDATPDAAAVSVDSSGFTGPASGATNVQAALAALDGNSGGGGSASETTFTFEDASGLTLSPDPSPGGAGESASVSGGALVLTIPDGVDRRYDAGQQYSPWASVSLLDAAGRAPSRVRVTARVQLASAGSLDPSTAARLVLIADSGERVAVWVKRDYWSFAYRTSVDSSANGTAPTLVGAWPAKADLADGLAASGTVWVEIEVSDQWVRTRYGLGTVGPVTAPTAWTEHARVGVTSAAGVPLRWTTAVLAASHEDASADGLITVTWDDLTVTRGAP